MVNKFLILAAFLMSASVAAQSVRPSLDLDSVRVEVTWVESRAELKSLRREWGQPKIDTVVRTRLTGFSVLGKRDGEYVCLLFVQRPESVDDRNTLALGHELLHCLAGQYH